ncbi:family 43 glycosylhydrolase [Massilia sp.]|uniref:family 43 glycosylhydrolase n=1 Tax=Massilia sp. TaxID=1882437 RepID=UPI00289D5619|nr:family 43 glycosylhydrolase [Massilia sp.]
MRCTQLATALMLAAVAVPAAAQTPYNAETTYRKLVRDYPFLRIASAEAPAPVQVRKDLVYVRRGELALALDLYLPAPGAAPAPLVLLVHGGGWSSGERSNMAPLAARLAAHGYAAATVSYRLSGQARYPAAIDDVKAALDWLRAQAGGYRIDPARVAIAGGSAGGQIAALVGLTRPHDVRAVINIDGLSDFTSQEALRHEDDPAKNPSAAGAWFGGRYADKAALWREASPLTHAGKDSPPVQFIVSSVPRFSSGREALAARLATYGIPTDTVALDGAPHSFWLFDPWVAPTVDAMTGFLARTLGPVAARAPWSPDLGDGRYRNPILHADYSDPDAIRVGDRYYMVSSSFANAPGLPLLTSTDMVNWELVGHALPQLVPGAAFATPQHGKGVWAPSLRHHDGRFWIFYPDPDHGVYVTTAIDFSGPWSAPHLLLPGKGIIDPAPLWDDDGRAWLIHAWAKSRAGFNNVLTLRRMAPDGRSLLDREGSVVIDGNRLPGYRTLEGPKLYKRNGWYYVFAPAGGVEHGWQSVFRSRRIEGPYEDRIVMEQGATDINGPHQGAWVTTPQGGDWFFHFQDRRAYGRVVQLQPLRWIDDWPLIGEPSGKPGVGQPVREHAKPVGGEFARRAPAVGDEFDGAVLGPQWQWAANPQPGWHALDARAGHLRLFAQPALPVRALPSVLTQKFPAPAFGVTARVELRAQRDGDQVGLGTMGLESDWFGVRRVEGRPRIVSVRCALDGACAETIGAALPGYAVSLRMHVTHGARVAFSYSADGVRFTALGEPFDSTMGRWVGAQIGLFATGARDAWADIDYVRITP